MIDRKDGVLRIAFQRRRFVLSVDLLLKWVGIFSPVYRLEGVWSMDTIDDETFSFLGSSQMLCTFGFCINIYYYR